MPFPTFSEAIVVAQDARVPGVHVILASGQQPGWPVKMLHHGAADAVAVDHAPLPRPGTKGLVIFPSGDPRNGVWLGSTYLALQDAYPTETDPNMRFNSHWSGAYEMTDGSGNWVHWHPDGTFIQVGDTTSPPAIYRHTVDPSQQRQLTLFPDSERVPNPPSPRHVVIKHGGGSQVHIDGSSNVSVTGATGATLTLVFGGTTVTIDPSGNVTFALAGGAVFDITQGGAAASDQLALVSKLVAWLAAHTHGNGNGGSPTTAPIQVITSGTIKSSIVNTSG